jgi:hypothetical protein
MVPVAYVQTSFHGMPAVPVPFLIIPSDITALGIDVIRKYNLLVQNTVIEYMG